MEHTGLSRSVNIFGFEIQVRHNRKPAAVLAKNFEEKQMEWFGYSPSKAGVPVTAESSIRAASVFSCVRILSEAVAMLPLILYRRVEKNGREGKERATNHPLYRLLHLEPNDEQTSFEFRELLQRHLVLRGNAFAFIDWARNGRVRRLIPLHPDRVGFEKVKGQLQYSYRHPDSNVQSIFDPYEVMHLRGLSTDGLRGLSPIETAREAVGLSIATEEYGARFFANGTHVGTYLETPNELGEKARKNLQESMSSNYGGVVNAHKIPILENGLKMQRLNMSTRDAQFIESRRFQLLEICRIFRVPPHKVYELERATFSNIEQQSIDFVTDSIQPWITRWEQRLNMSLLNESERDRYFFEFKLDALLRGETKARQESLQIMRRNGVINANEWRAIENMNPREDEGGDEYFTDKAMTDDGGSPEEVRPPSGGGQGGAEGDSEDEK